jgi:hypothetical protein
METIQQVERGAAAFVDKVMAPLMPKAKGIAFAALAPMVIKAKIKEYAPMAQSLGILEEEHVDIDLLYQAFKEKAQGKWPIDLMGFKFAEEDLDKLYRTIKEA